METIRIKKGSAVPLLVVVIIAICVFLMIAVAGGTQIFTIKESIDLYNRYYTTSMDKEIQSLKQGFLKTAAFNSLHETFYDLTKHGNIPEDMLKDTDRDTYVDGIYPCMRLEYVDEAIFPLPLVTPEPYYLPYWAYPGNEEMNYRVPYIVAKNPGLTVGNHEYCLEFNDEGQLDPYIRDLQEGRYDMTLIVSVMMRKKGTVMISAPDYIEMYPSSVQTETDAIFEFEITGISADVLSTHKTCPLSLNFHGIDGRGGTDTIGQINYIALSIYDSDVANAQNNLFTEHLNEYRSNLETTILANDDDEENDISVSISDLEGLYTPSSFLRGTVWSKDDGIIASVKDNIAVDDDLAIIQSSGLVQEEVKLRHNDLNIAGEYVVQNIDSIKDEIYAQLSTLDDYYHDSIVNTQCQSLEHDWQISCPDDETPSYESTDFLHLIELALKDSEDDFNDRFEDKGIEIELMAPKSIKTLCENSRTNYNKDSKSEPDNCLGGLDENIDNLHDAFLVYNEFVENSCSKDECYHEERIACDGTKEIVYYDVECTKTYAHRYVLKNIKVLVRVKDTQYRYFNADINTWVEPVLQFYVMIDRIEDNECGADSDYGGHLPCDRVTTTDHSC